MSTLIKLVIAALVLNACFQGGRSAWGFYQFQDEVQQAVLFSTSQSADQLKARIQGVADEMQKELEPETFTVSYQGTQAKIRAAYTDEVAILPGGSKYMWRHALDVDLRRMSY